MKKEELVLRFREDKSILVEILEDQNVRTKIISVEDLQECFKKSLSGVKVSTGLLPANTVSFRVDTENGRRYVVLEFSETHAVVTSRTTEYPHFPLPRLLFGFTVEASGRISAVNMGIPALGKLTPDTPMYYYPLSNVSRFSLCTGANTLPTVKTIQSLQNLPYYILSLPDNDDRYNDKYNRLSLGHRDLMEHLKDKDRQYYYDHVLVPMPNTKLQDFL